MVRKSLLGGRSAGGFLREHWQKKPLLARRAFPDLADIVDRDSLIACACRDDAEARLVLRDGRRWQVRRGPFVKRDFSRLPKTRWTLLVNGLDRMLPRAHALLREFSFLSYSRLDDVMASYAAPGGGVGPHFDSYDVFLLQGAGNRRWRISSQRAPALIANAPLKLIRNFRAEQDWLLERGDLLYLPPNCAHEGVAVGDCISYSIGFRAPGASELTLGFLDYLRDTLAVDGRYGDPELKPTRHPARISTRMTSKVGEMLGAIQWSSSEVRAFVGQFLSEPGNAVFFEPPAKPLRQNPWRSAIARRGVRLDLRTRLLFDGHALYINGERYPRSVDSPELIELADRGELAPGAVLTPATARLLYQWYRAGYIHAGHQYDR